MKTVARILLGVILVALASTSARSQEEALERQKAVDFFNEDSPLNGNTSVVLAYRDRPREVPTGNWIQIVENWSSRSDAYQDEFLDNTTFEVVVDGVPLLPSELVVAKRDELRSFLPFGVDLCLPHLERYYLLRPLRPGVHTIDITFTWLEDVCDGFDVYPGEVVEEVSRTLYVTPRELYPQHTFVDDNQEIVERFELCSEYHFFCPYEHPEECCE